jgi:hypothetical protein
MGQYDSSTEAALARLKSESLSSSPVEKKVDKILTLGGIILEAVGVKGASGATRFFTTLKSLAADKDESNLIYFGNALIDDIRRLYRLYEGLKQQFDERISSPEFNTVIANATLYITRTNVEKRLRRLAHLIANGVKEDDLESESLDDMMRAAVELKDDDIQVLDRLCEEQIDILATTGKTHGDLWPDDVRRNWQQHLSDHGIPGRSGQHYLDWRSSLARLSAFGFLIPIQPVQTVNSPGHEPYGVSLQGVEFLKRLKEAQ